MQTIIGIILASLVAASSASALSSSGTDTLWGEEFSSPVYVERFQGGAYRTLEPDRLRITLRQRAGIFDTAIRYYYKGRAVDDIHPLYYVHAKWRVQAPRSTLWWTGPKISINYTPSLEGWYETYIVENSTRTWQQWRDALKGGYEGYNYLGKTFHDGSFYDHYRVKLGWWDQFYAVRRNRRTGGIVSIASHLNYWRAVGGLPNLPVDEIRLNVEAIGRNDLNINILPYYVPVDYMSEPDTRPDSITQ